MRETPYIGVTGPTSQEEVRHATKAFSDNGVTLESNHLPMIGFLVSQKTLSGAYVQNRRYPKFDALPDLLKETDHSTFNTIHYNSRQLLDLDDQILSIFKGQIYEDKLCRGLQLNVFSPPPEQLLKVKRTLPDLKIILALSGGVLRDKDGWRSPEDVVGYTDRYKDLADYALIDPSGGRGLSLDISEAVIFYRALREAFPDLGLGVAGGLTGKNLKEQGETLINELGTKDLSTDAERGLRNIISDEYGDDLYSGSKVEDYIKVAGELFS